MKVGIVGASGYSGLELIRVLHMHPYIEQLNFYALTSNSNDISEYYPHLTSIVNGPIQKWDADQSINENDIVFLATPHGVSSEIVMNISEEHVKIIDLSGDFRLKEEQKYN
ncbi:N-acetyl-gamma-glutamyl-phosphate reductase, partial [Bacillus velezensis]